MSLRLDSPLRSLPANLDPKQTLFLDGIRYSVEMAALAYGRLGENLFRATELLKEAQDSSGKIPHAAVFLDAWSIIDSTHRLRELLQQMPGIRKRPAEPVGLFLRESAQVENFRHIIQHLRREIPTMAEKSWPVWGTITWVLRPNDHKNLVQSCLLIAGKIHDGNYDLINPLGKTLLSKVDLITLTCEDKSICISDLIRSVGRLVDFLETVLDEKFKDLPKSQADIVASIDCEF